MGRKSYYGVVGNGETCALISPRGSIDWLCLPKFDGDILLSKSLDPVNGSYIDIVFMENNEELLVQETSQKYIPLTNILVTTIKMKDFETEIKDFMPWSGAVHVAPGSERALIRIIKIKNISESEKQISIKVRTNLVHDSNKACGYIKDGETVYKNPKFLLGVTFFGDVLDEIKIRAGSSAAAKIGIVYDESAKHLNESIRQWSSRDVEKELEICKEFWLNWIERGRMPKFEDNEFKEIYCRAFLILKLLSYEKTGAVLAAPTASFPAYPGMFENWDYRFTWIRDSYFICKAFLMTGHYSEVKKILNFFYSVQGEDGHWKFPFCTIDGGEPGNEITIENLKGPKGETVVVGNTAKDQLQLDSEGSILYATYLYFLFTKDRDLLEKFWPNVENSANWIMANYRKEENGPWELRERRAHYIYGKVLCWVGLESATNIGKILGKKANKKWIETKKNLKKQIVAKGWSKQRQSFLQTYDNDSPIDISVLALEDYGLVKPTDHRMKKTVKLIEKKLNINGGIARFENAVLPFYLPTLWLAGHYIRVRNMKRAKELINLSIGATTDLYLAAEHFDPVNGNQHGNFPQTFCMSSFIEQLFMLTKSKKEISYILNILNTPLKFLLQSFIIGGKTYYHILQKMFSIWTFKDREKLTG